jgi:plasmid maintenance system antidote protein VapI
MPRIPKTKGPADLEAGVGDALADVLAGATELTRSLSVARDRLHNALPASGMTLQEWFAATGIMPTKLAGELGMHFSTIIEMRSGRRWPNSNTALRIKEATGGAVTLWDITYFQANRRIHAYQRPREEVEAAKAAKIARSAMLKAEREARRTKRRPAASVEIKPEPAPQKVAAAKRRRA